MRDRSDPSEKEGPLQGGTGGRSLQKCFIFYGGNWRDLLHDYTAPLRVVSVGNNDAGTRTSNTGRDGDDSLLNDPRAQDSMTTSQRRVRQYYHCNGQVVLPNEGLYDSDADVSSEWITRQEHDLIDEFTDLSWKEKQMMNMWNSFVSSFYIHANMYFPVSTELFSRRFAPDILRLGLRHVFLLHLVAMWDLCLLSGDDIVKCIAIIDSANPIFHPPPISHSTSQGDNHK
jgi:hypothetical protein